VLGSHLKICTSESNPLCLNFGERLINKSFTPHRGRDWLKVSCVVEILLSQKTWGWEVGEGRRSQSKSCISYLSSVNAKAREYLVRRYIQYVKISRL
jgi:hypothetical protein